MINRLFVEIGLQPLSDGALTEKLLDQKPPRRPCHALSAALQPASIRRPNHCIRSYDVVMPTQFKFIHIALILSVCACAACASAQASPWQVFVDAAYQDGGSPADRTQVLGTPGYVPLAGEYSQQHAWIGSVGVGRELASGLFVTLSAGSSTAMKSRFGANTKPIGAPAYLTATSSSKRDSALLLLGYRLFEMNKFSAYAAAGIEYSRSTIDSEYVSFFIYPGQPYYLTHRVSATVAAAELGARYALTPALSVGPFARLLEGQRGAFGVRLSAFF